MDVSYADYIPALKAMADETRLRIIDMLSCEELCANDILHEFKISQSTLSYHMKILTDADIVVGRRAGAHMWYSLNKKKSGQLLGFLEWITRYKEDCICRNIRKGKVKYNE